MRILSQLRDGGGTAALSLAPAANVIQTARQSMTRDQFFTGLFILCCANGLASPVADAIGYLGWSEALLATFNVSVFVWFASFAAASLLLRSETYEKITKFDICLGLAALAAAMVPLGKLSWLALSGLGFYILAQSPADSVRARGAFIVVALTGPMLWGPLLLGTIGQPIVRADAAVVSLLIGTERVGNVVKFVDGGGTFQISPSCSSLQGMSIAILAWVTISQMVGRGFDWSRRWFVWCALAASSVMIVNHVRLSVIGLFREHFDVIHGPLGTAIAGWFSLAVILVICLLGVRRELFARI